MSRKLLSVLLACIVALGAGVSQYTVVRADSDAEARLRQALELARQTGSYRVDVDVTQTILPLISGSGGVPRAARSETLAYVMEGMVRDAQNMRFTMRDKSATAGIQTALNKNASTDLLVAGGVAYQRRGDTWERQSDTPTPGINSDSLLLLDVARDMRLLPTQQGLDVTFARVAFSLHSDDVLRHLLSLRGQNDVQSFQRLRDGGLYYAGAGELWINERGYPARLLLNLSFERGGADAYRARVTSSADYSQFGETFPEQWFDPAVAPLSLESRSALPGVSLTHDQLTQSALQVIGLMAGLLAVGVLILLAGKRRRLSIAINVTLIVALVTPYVARADDSYARTEQAPAQRETEVGKMARQAREVARTNQIGPYSPQLAELPEQGDADGDGLPNGYEIRLGTNPYAKDTDMDGIDDRTEVMGQPCARYPGDPTPVMVITDPLNPDSNYDGIRDGDEFRDGKCWTGKQPNAWSDDNDGDGVPDALDLSPFSVSGVLGAEFVQNYPAAGYSVPKPGANLTFDPVGGNFGGISASEPFYVEVQVRPTDAEQLKYAYKDALYWQKGDDLGQIRNINGMTSTGKLTLAPFLEVTVEERDLPAASARAQYGLSASKVISGCVNNCQHRLVIPLAPVERFGITYAFQGKAFYLLREAQPVKWHDMRFKWALQGDVARPGPNDTSVPGTYGLAIYDEGYRVTGINVSRQGGVETLVAAAQPTSGPADFTAGPVALLRAGLEARFMPGGISIPNIQQRFDASTAATVPITDRWGITFTYHITSQVNFVHMDEALLTTNITMTRAMLDKAYPTRNYTPTLIIATQQRTANINLDELENPDFSDLSINICGKDLVTSRSLKLATYAWDPNAATGSLSVFDMPVATDDASGSAGGALYTRAPLAPAALGDWFLLGMEELLKHVEKNYADIFSPDDPLYKAGLTILKMITATWHEGITAIQNMGAINWQDIENAITDPQLYGRIFNWLIQQGYLPTQLTAVVDFVLGVWEAGGPIAWLEQQWNSAVAFIDGLGRIISGSVLNFTLTVPPIPDGGVSISLGDLLSFSKTAIGILNYFATLFGAGVLADVAQVLASVLQVIGKVQAVWNAIQAGIQALQQGVQVALEVVANELSKLAKPMGAFGLILAIGFTVFNLFMQLAQGNLSLSVIIQVILQAVWEIVKQVALFIVSAIFPIGTIIAAAVALINWLIDFIGGVAGQVLQWIFDPISAFFSSFNPDPEQLTRVFGSPSISNLAFERLADSPLGGVFEGQTFRFTLTSTVTMNGVKRGLNQSGAKMRFGRYADGTSFDLCGFQIFQFLQGANRTSEINNYIMDIATSQCRKFSFGSEYRWNYSDKVQQYTKSSQYLTDTLFLPNGMVVELPFDIRLRDFTTYGALDITPYRPAINGKVPLDVSYDLTTWWENCGILGLDCDEYPEKFSTPPSGSTVYFDILPVRLRDLWNWEDLFNKDKDGDGVVGWFGSAGQAHGLDATFAAICGTNATITPDTDGDGLSDGYELQADTQVCTADTDGDGIPDGRELEIGTDPTLADTDGDGLSDFMEVAFWQEYATALNTSNLWTVDMQGLYPGLPDPVAFPNPRHANFDNDHRTDSREKAKRSSPNAWNPIALDDTLEMSIAQQYVSGGGTRLTVTSMPWMNDEATALTATLRITLPVAFSGVTAAANMITKTGSAALDTPIALAGLPPNVVGWRFPPLWHGRKFSVTLTGLPQIPPGSVTVSAGLTYDEGGSLRQSTTDAVLLINRGGPEVRITAPITGSIVGAAGAIVEGLGSDPQGVKSVQVCIKTSPACAPGDWQTASGGRFWSYMWVPPASGLYYLYARGVDAYDVQGAADGPIVVKVDTEPPNGAEFAANNTLYLSTTLNASAQPVVTLTGYVTDTPGTFASGANAARINIRGNIDITRNQTVNAPGVLGSQFNYVWALPLGSFGKAAPAANRAYTATVRGVDVAGNLSTVSETLKVVIDDYPPLAQTIPPQTASGAFTLTGNANDLALPLRWNPNLPFARTQALPARDTRFGMTESNNRALVVGDVNGDTINDIAVMEEIDKVLHVGLFFGKPGGFASNLALANADVRLIGETSNTSGYPRSIAVSTGAAGDLNGDGVGDLVIGDRQIGDGKVYVLLGKRGWVNSGWVPTYTLSSSADWVLTRANAQGFGVAVAFAGDVDGDGLADLLVGEQQETSASQYYDNTYLYLGRERGTPAIQSQIRGWSCAVSCVRRGPNLAGVGDTNGDGLSDFLIALPTSRVALIYGRPKQSWVASTLLGGGTLPNAWLNGANPQQTVSTVGDINGDGLNDMLIGDPLTVGTGATVVYVLFGRKAESPFPTPPLTVSLPVSASASFLAFTINFGGGTDSHIGNGLTPMGDLDGDGKADFAFGQDGNGSRFNRTAIVLGGYLPQQLNMPVISATLFVTGTAHSQASGFYLSSGDVTGDGVRDILIGAPGESGAYLFHGKLATGEVSGIAKVLVGMSGPITNPNLLLTQTLPTAWTLAALRLFPGAAIDPWRAVITPTSGNGDYRVYARAIDMAGNEIDSVGWYVGNVLVNNNAVAIPSITASINPPVLTKHSSVSVTLSGRITSTPQIQHAQVFDGINWHRLPPASGAWNSNTLIPRADLRRYDMRVVTRDAFGNAAHFTRTVTTDTLVLPADLGANIESYVWQTNITPTLIVTWTAVTDASGVTRYASIDTISNTNPVTVVVSNQITRLLNAPGIYYAHVRVVDGAGNQRLTHSGPFPVNRTTTPSAALPDGELSAGEWSLVNVLNYDPYSQDRPALLYGTWDANTLWLAHTGNSWSENKRFAVYLDTVSGGGTTSLGIGEPVHTLPMRADFAMLISGNNAYSMYRATGAGWTPIGIPTSFAIADTGTEIAFRRSEISATGAVNILAYAFDDLGIFSVMPGGARPTSTTVISGPITFALANGYSPINLSSLGNGISPFNPNAVTRQVLDPIITIDPGADTVLTPTQMVSLTIRVEHPDVFPYLAVPMTITLGSAAPQYMGFFGGVTGASCGSCAQNSRQWVVSVTLSGGNSTIIGLSARALTPTLTGIYTVPVTVRMAQHGLPGIITPTATASYAVDYSVAKPSFANALNTIFVKPGLVKLPIFNDGRYTGQCKQTVLGNIGAGFNALGSLGTATEISGTVNAGQSQVWQLRARGPNGQLSEIMTRTVVADNSAPPVVQFNPNFIITKTTMVLGGAASDNNALGYVQVSINGGPFYKAVFADGSVLARGATEVATTNAYANWQLPLNLGEKDNVTFNVTARAVDAAGNVGPLSAAQVITIDNVGPQVTAALSGTLISGTVIDGSGVASVEVSINGGLNYTPASFNGGAWSGSAAGAFIGFVLVRATDVHGNETILAVPADNLLQVRIYMPQIMR